MSSSPSTLLVHPPSYTNALLHFPPTSFLVLAVTACLLYFCGTCVYNLFFSPLAAMAGRVCIAQVEELVDPGVLDPDAVHLPGVFVDRIVEVGTDIEKRIERRTTRSVGEGS